jgi:hypothetical protein
VPAEGTILSSPSQAVLSDFDQIKFRPAILSIQYSRRFRRVVLPCRRSQSLVKSAVPRGAADLYWQIKAAAAWNSAGTADLHSLV